MITQSYGLLNSVTLNKVLAKVRELGKELDVRPVASIHDANYFYIRNDIEVLHWFNALYIEMLEDYDLPELQHPVVKLTGDLELYSPTWAHSSSIPVYDDIADTLAACKRHTEKHSPTKTGEPQ